MICSVESDVLRSCYGSFTGFKIRYRPYISLAGMLTLVQHVRWIGLHLNPTVRCCRTYVNRNGRIQRREPQSWWFQFLLYPFIVSTARVVQWYVRYEWTPSCSWTSSYSSWSATIKSNLFTLPRKTEGEEKSNHDLENDNITVTSTSRRHSSSPKIKKDVRDSSLRLLSRRNLGILSSVLSILSSKNDGDDFGDDDDEPSTSLVFDTDTVIVVYKFYYATSPSPTTTSTWTCGIESGSVRTGFRVAIGCDSTFQILSWTTHRKNHH